ncbi:peptidylprolyl isomerase [Flavobacterium alkalisoli]|uniref:peptidylprolyl isomerase n=1 Tax=Flavobacterium alkalisoli TaxID=2602769 RepID=UPI003A8CAEF5
MKPMTSLFLSLVALLFSCKNTDAVATDPKLGDGLYAEITTNKGKILLQLEYEKTPLTVANFVSLAEGTNEMVVGDRKGKPFYDGLKFHRVIKSFMIQTGDPNGNGSGGPGYKFPDEITDLKHDKEGILSMANAGANTNGSQFFITHKATPHLDGIHTVFGHVIEGQDVVNLIENGDDMISVKIIRVGKEAKKFKADKVFKEYYEKAAEEQKKKAEELAKAKTDMAAYISELKTTGTKTASGLVYKILEKGSGQKPLPGSEVYLDYSGFLENGTLFDSSDVETAKKFGNYIPQKDAAGAYTPIPFQTGKKTGMIPGFIEAIEQMNIGDKLIAYIPSHLAYGERGAGGVIPPNANITFEIKLLDKMPEKK